MHAADVQVLVTAHFPSLSVADVHLLGAGFDFDAWLVRDSARGDWVFRFPQRPEVVDRLNREIAWLPHVGAALDGITRVPQFDFVAERSLSFPHPFVGYRLLPGRPLFDLVGAEVPPPRAARALGTRLAEVFRALHGIDPETVPGTRFPHEVGTPASWHAHVDGARPVLLEALPGPLASDSRRWLDRLQLPEGNAGLARLVHNDLGSVHVLVDDDRVLTGLLDFGDLDLGDPATDIAYVTSWLGPLGTKALLQAYGASAGFEARVRTVGVLLAMSWILECVQVTHGPPQDFHFDWLRTALAVAG